MFGRRRGLSLLRLLPRARRRGTIRAATFLLLFLLVPFLALVLLLLCGLRLLAAGPLSLGSCFRRRRRFHRGPAEEEEELDVAAPALQLPKEQR